MSVRILLCAFYCFVLFCVSRDQCLVVRHRRSHQGHRSRHGEDLWVTLAQSMFQAVIQRSQSQQWYTKEVSVLNWSSYTLTVCWRQDIRSVRSRVNTVRPADFMNSSSLCFPKLKGKFHFFSLLLKCIQRWNKSKTTSSHVQASPTRTQCWLK